MKKQQRCAFKHAADLSMIAAELDDGACVEGRQFMEPRAGFDPATCRFLAVQLQGGRSLVRLICQAEPPRRDAEYKQPRLKFSRLSPFVTFGGDDERGNRREFFTREHTQHCATRGAHVGELV